MNYYLCPRCNFRVAANKHLCITCGYQIPIPTVIKKAQPIVAAPVVATSVGAAPEEPKPVTAPAPNQIAKPQISKLRELSRGSRHNSFLAKVWSVQSAVQPARRRQGESSREKAVLG